MKYSLLGYSSGPDYFTIGEDDGVIKVKNDLRNDNAKLIKYRLLVQALLKGVRTQIVTATVNIEVVRNENGPKFEPDRYNKNVDEDFPLGETLITVRATDKDNVSRILYNKLLALF